MLVIRRLLLTKELRKFSSEAAEGRQKARGKESACLVAFRPEPLASFVVPLILETHSNSVAIEAPQVFLQPVAIFFLPLAGEKLNNFLPPLRPQRGASRRAKQQLQIPQV